MTDIVPYTRAPAGRFAADWLLDPAEIANRIGGTDFVPTSLRNNPAAITAALLYGQEAGLGPMQSLAKIAVINGRPTMAAEAMRALILQAGHDIWIEELSVSRCTVAGQRRDSDQISRVTWSMDDARRAGLAGKPPWKAYPRQMLLARASAELARAIFPDAIAGMAATEELEDEPDQAQAANGADQAPPTSRRRRRTSVTAQASEPSPPPTPEPTPEPTPAPSPFQPPPRAMEPTTSALPPEEQAVLDQLQRDFDAQETGAGADGPAPAPTEEPPRITDPQRRKIHALFREQGISDRTERLAICSNILDRDIPTSTSLTTDEASQIIDHLEEEGRL